MLHLTKRIKELYDNDEFQIIIIEGWNGYGKTTYANKGIAEIYSKDGLHKNWDVGLFKNHLGFHPLRVLNKWNSMKERDYVFHWDDAGSWLHSLDFNNPYVKQVGKYPQTARTDWGAIIFSCIDADDIIKKVRCFSSMIKIKITKHSNINQPHRRIATAKHPEKDWYNNIHWIDDWDEEFDCYVPDPFYEWYNPLRRKYSKMAKKLAKMKAMQEEEIVKTYRDSTL